MSYFKVICQKFNSDTIEEIDTHLYDEAFSEWKNAEAMYYRRAIVEVYESSDINKEGERFQTYEREYLDE